MDRKKKLVSRIIDQGILPQYYHQDAGVSVQILKALYNAGIRVVEYANRGENAVDNFLQLRKFADKEMPGLLLGAGTIRNKIEATEFINEGAGFIICPGVIESVANLANDNNLLWIPGCLTSTEIIQADELGAELIKLFPGHLLGYAYLTFIKEVFPDLLFMPTGDVETNAESLTTWFNSGASVVGLGNTLISKSLLEAKNYAGIESITRETLQVLKGIKKL
ncbi:MAG: bifunctional 4-hydroxy-2-oxoglutarate aldolase/2-dehydro-3-deoxy-phosphogluconate aldolase [Ferruginibacter sp.]